MADGKTGRKRKVVVEAEALIPVAPGQGELFGGVPAETVTGSPSAGQDLLPVAVGGVSPNPRKFCLPS